MHLTRSPNGNGNRLRYPHLMEEFRKGKLLPFRAVAICSFESTRDTTLKTVPLILRETDQPLVLGIYMELTSSGDTVIDWVYDVLFC